MPLLWSPGIPLAGKAGRRGVAGAALDVTAPATPTGFDATVGDSQVDLTWNLHPDTDGDLAAINVYRCQGPGCSGPSLLTTLGPAATSYTDASAVNNTTYRYAISAEDTAGNESALTDLTSNKKPVPPPTPSRAWEMNDTTDLTLVGTATVDGASLVPSEPAAKSLVCPGGGANYAHSATSWTIPSGAWTVAFWMHPDDFVDRNLLTFLPTTAPSATKGWAISRLSNQYIRVGVGSDVDETFTTSVNGTTHIVVRKRQTGSDDVACYHDGELVGSVASPNPWAGTAGTLYFGAGSGDLTGEHGSVALSRFVGRIDKVQMFHRGLTDDEIRVLYRSHL